MFNLNKIAINSIKVIWLYKNNTKTHYTHNGNLKCYELAYNLHGNEIINFNHKDYKIKADTLLFLPAGIVDANYECNLLGFDNQKIIIAFTTTSPMPEEAVTMYINENSKLKSLFIKINNYWNSGEQTIDAYYKCMATLYQIFAEISQLDNQYNPKFSKLTPAVKYLDENFRNPDFRDYPKFCVKS